MIQWHRLFGLALSSFFRDSPFEVELEKDLSLKRQLLDVVIVRKRAGILTQPLPDGLDNLAEHNLLTYKSWHEPLDDWVLKELTGHYVNYRKQISAWKKLLPEEKFRLYALSTRWPQKLASQVELHPLSSGVYELNRGTDGIRLIVLPEIPQNKRNALWHLFSGIPRLVEFALNLLHTENPEISRVIHQVLKEYQQKGNPMVYTMEDFNKDFVKDNLNLLSSAERLEGLSSEDRLKGLSSEEVLKQFSSEARLKGLSSEEVLKQFSSEEVLKQFSSEEVLKGLSLKEIEAYLKRSSKR